MTPEFKALKEAVERERHDGRMAGIRRTFAAYEKSLETSHWYCGERYFLLKPKGMIEP